MRVGLNAVKPQRQSSSLLESPLQVICLQQKPPGLGKIGVEPDDFEPVLLRLVETSEPVLRLAAIQRDEHC